MIQPLQGVCPLNIFSVQEVGIRDALAPSTGESDKRSARVCAFVFDSRLNSATWWQCRQCLHQRGLHQSALYTGTPLILIVCNLRESKKKKHIKLNFRIFVLVLRSYIIWQDVLCISSESDYNSTECKTIKMPGVCVADKQSSLQIPVSPGVCSWLLSGGVSMGG